MKNDDFSLEKLNFVIVLLLQIIWISIFCLEKYSIKGQFPQPFLAALKAKRFFDKKSQNLPYQLLRKVLIFFFTSNYPFFI